MFAGGLGGFRFVNGFGAWGGETGRPGAAGNGASSACSAKSMLMARAAKGGDRRSPTLVDAMHRFRRMLAMADFVGSRREGVGAPRSWRRFLGEWRAVESGSA